MKRKLFLPLVLVMAVILSLGLVIGVMAQNNEPELKLTGANLVFSERVHILWAVDTENVADTDKVELLIFRGENIKIADCTKGNEVAALTNNGKTVNEGSVKGMQFEYTEIAAAEMTENIYARAYYTDENGTYYSPVVKYSVLQYACNKLGMTSNNATTNTKLANMIKGMLIYGAAAQEYFEVNLDRLATDEYVRYDFADGVVADGLGYGLYKKGEKFTVTATTVTDGAPYAVWKDANGNVISKGATAELTATENRVLTAAPQSTEPTFGSYKYVVIVGVDGAGSFYPDETNTPNIDRIFANGSVTRTMRVTSPSSSSISWSSCLHGVLPENHGNTENAQVENGVPYPMDSKYPSILRVVKEARPDEEVACFYAWIGINGIVEDGAGIEKQRMSDGSIVSYLESGYLEKAKPTLTYLHFNEPDSVGHNVGHHTEDYYKSIENIDAYIGRIYDAYEKAGMIEDTLFIVTADHGGINKTHGGLTDVEKYVMFAAAGKNVSNSPAEDMYIRDTSAIVLHALGIEQPETYTSLIPNGVFADMKDMPRVEYHDPDQPRYHLPEQTPAAGNDRYVTNFVDNTLAVYLPFDESTAEVVNGSVVDSFGKITYQDGYFGKGVQLEDGHLNVHANFAPGTNSFTISTWAKFNTPDNGYSPMIATKAISSSSAGFVFATGRYASVERQDHYGMFELANGSDRVRYSGGAECPELAFPTDYIYGWLHLLITVDKDAGLISVSYDFNESYVVDMPASIINGNLTAVLDYITLGNDTTGAASMKSGVAFDEFMIWDGALDATDVAGLMEYYGVESNEGEADDNTVLDALNPDVFFEFDGYTKNEGVANTDVGKYGTTNYADGIRGKAAYLAGSNYYTLKDIKVGTGSYSVATWIKPTDLKFNSGAYRLPIISTSAKDNRETLGLNVIINTEHGGLLVTLGDGTDGVQEQYIFYQDTYNTSNNDPNLPLHSELENTWMHIAVSVDRQAQKLVVYLNFKEVINLNLNYYGTSTKFPTSVDLDANTLTVGQYGVPGASHTPDYYLDDLMFFRRAITASEMATIHRFYMNPLSDYIDKAPVINLGFEGNVENTGSYDGNIEQEGTINYVNGYLGAAAEFKTGSVDLQDLELGDNSMTVSLWYNTANISYSAGGRPYRSNLFATAYKANSNYEGIHIDFSREYNCIFVQTQNSSDSNRGYIMAYFDESVQNNQWVNITVVINTNPTSGEKYVDVYLNFKKVTNVSETTPVAFGQNSFDGGEGFTPHIGADGQGNLDYTANGYIDEFLMFDCALTEEEIAALAEYYNQ